MGGFFPSDPKKVVGIMALGALGVLVVNTLGKRVSATAPVANAVNSGV